jgi:hypothetical protein
MNGFLNGFLQFVRMLIVLSLFLLLCQLLPISASLYAFELSSRMSVLFALVFWSISKVEACRGIYEQV